MNAHKLDQRKYPRVAIDNLVTYILIDENGGEVGQGIGKALNVSQGGILIETKKQVASRYLFLVSTDIDDNLIENIGKVIFSRADEAGEVFHTGISFRGDHVDNVNFRKDLIRLYHRRHVLKQNQSGNEGEID